jgi:hypothetical protein
MIPNVQEKISLFSLAMLRIRNVYSGSRIQILPSRIPGLQDLGSGSATLFASSLLCHRIRVKTKIASKAETNRIFIFQRA